MDIACVGDLMFECILHDASLPEPNRTLIVNSPSHEFGGATFNTCWNLAHLGNSPRLVGFIGRRQAAFVRQELAKAHLTDAGIVDMEGDTDLLVVLKADKAYRGLYLRNHLPDSLASDVFARVGTPDCLVLVGSRHPALRRISLNLLEAFRGKFLTFSPAYAIYEYGPDELQRLIRKSSLTIVNADEAAYVCQTLHLTSIDQLTATLSGIFIVTLAHDGARVFEHDRVLELGSYTELVDDVFGAGDAFLAGFLFEKLRGASTADAARFGSMCGAYIVEANPRRVRVPLVASTILQQLVSRSHTRLDDSRRAPPRT
jgi:sugar/nucleoside kinase (ribokinase family)